MEVTPEDAAKLANKFDTPLKAYNDGFYLGKDPQEPAVGDLKVTFQVVKAGPVSVIARQIGQTFEPYTVGKLGTIDLLEEGTVSAESMFASEQSSNRIITWIVRVAGFAMMFFGILLLGSPLAVLGDVIPFIGSIVGAGLGLLALVIAAPLTLITVAIAWIAVRPMVGIPLLVLAVVGIAVGLWALLSRRKPEAA